MITNTSLCTISHQATYYDPESPKFRSDNSDRRRYERQHRRRSTMESAAVPRNSLHGDKYNTSTSRWYRQAKMMFWRVIDFLDKQQMLRSVTPEEMLRREKKRSKKTKRCQSPKTVRAPDSETVSTAHGAYTSDNFMPPFARDRTTPADLSPFRGETILDRAFRLQYIPGSEQQGSGAEKLSSVARFDALLG
ncbi:hypothetical protein F5883DRAFT_566551 [Diaporthe sp. PMI_573]|nr:hypothetical protein F5883DRAFT_566551 [Diaporthaceae sp. PMI_573]